MIAPVPVHCFSITFSGKMLIADCHYLCIFLYLEEYESIRLDNTNYKGSARLKMLSVYKRAEVSWQFAIKCNKI